MPYNGIWLMTRKIKSVTPVHMILCWKGVLVSGTAISGTNGVNGFTRSRNRTVRACQSNMVLRPVYLQLVSRAPELIEGRMTMLRADSYCGSQTGRAPVFEMSCACSILTSAHFEGDLCESTPAIGTECASACSEQR